MKLLSVVVLAFVLSGCASTLPPHAWMEIPNVRGVDLFWWPDARVCQLRVITQPARDDWRGVVIDVDKTICLRHLKDEGFKVKP